MLPSWAVENRDLHGQFLAAQNQIEWRDVMMVKRKIRGEDDRCLEKGFDVYSRPCTKWTAPEPFMYRPATCWLEMNIRYTFDHARRR